MRKRVNQVVLVLVGVFLAYILFYPVPIDPQGWTPQADVGLTGQFAPNHALGALHKMANGQCNRCEDVAVDSLGNVYAGDVDGNILAFSTDFKNRRVLAKTGGRPLGMIVDKQGNVYTADSPKGLLKISPTGVLTVLTNSCSGRLITFADDLDFGPDSTIIFSEASDKFPDAIHMLDVFEHGANGNLFRYSLKTGKTEQLLDDLYFANGVAVSRDGSYVLVNNMTKYQVLKYFLSGAKKWKSEVFLDNLPGFPDGVNISPEGTIWLSMPSHRSEALDKLLPYPFLRKVIFMLNLTPEKPKHYGLILGFDESGKLVYNLHDPSGSYSDITNTVPFQNKLYLGSIYQTSIGVYELPASTGQ
ncbi:SMP-30/gluconolactonase/LRE family protein [Spirosoma aerophilum]